MSRFSLILAALVLAAPRAAAAIPPPPPVAVVLVHGGGPIEASERLLESVGNGAWFEATAAPVEATAFETCVDALEDEVCVREALAGVDRGGPAMVVILTRPSPGLQAAWRCIGEGAAPTNPERQFATFDTLAWGGFDGEPTDADRQAAAGCVLGAASESGW